MPLWSSKIVKSFSLLPIVLCLKFILLHYERLIYESLNLCDKKKKSMRTRELTTLVGKPIVMNDICSMRL